MPIRTHSLLRKRPENRCEVFGPLAQLGQLGLDGRARQRTIHHQRIDQVVDHARVVDQDLGQELAGRAQLDIEPQAGRIEVEKLPENRLGAQRAGHLLEVGQRHVRVGRAAHRLQQPRGDRRQKMTAPRLRQETESPREPGPSSCDRRSVDRETGRARAPHEMNSSLGCGSSTRSTIGSTVWPGVAAERIVEQVIENASIELGLAAVVGHEPGGRAVALFPGARRRVAHPQGQVAHRLRCPAASRASGGRTGSAAGARPGEESGRCRP